MSDRHKSFRNYESGSSKRKSAQEKEKKGQKVFAKSRKIKKLQTVCKGFSWELPLTLNLIFTDRVNHLFIFKIRNFLNLFCFFFMRQTKINVCFVYTGLSQTILLTHEMELYFYQLMVLFWYFSPTFNLLGTLFLCSDFGLLFHIHKKI